MNKLPRWLQQERYRAFVDEFVAKGRCALREGPSGEARPQLERTLTTTVEKADGADDVWTVTASDETSDRYGDVIVAAGWDFGNFSKNPVFLVDHRYWVESIVGVGLNPRVALQKFVIDFKADPAGSSPATDMVRSKLAAGSLRATSVGFIPLSWEKILDEQNEWTGGYKFLRSELLEVSWVAVPANPNATLSLPVSDGDSSTVLARLDQLFGLANLASQF